MTTVNKAIAGAVVTAVVSYASRHGYVLDQDTSDAIVVVLAAILGFASVWALPNKIK